MPTNFPGPYEVEIFYTVDGIVHIQRLNCKVVTPPTPGDDPDTIDLVNKDASSTQLDTAVTLWVTLLKARFSDTSTFDSFNFWEYEEGTFNRTFITAGDLAIAGTNVSDHEPAHQQTLTFRTLEGGNMKVVLLESVDSSDVKIPYASLGSGLQAIMDFVVDDTSWIIARDTSVVIAKLNGVGGENEALFRERFR